MQKLFFNILFILTKTSYGIKLYVYALMYVYVVSTYVYTFMHACEEQRLTCLSLLVPFYLTLWNRISQSLKVTNFVAMTGQKIPGIPSALCPFRTGIVGMCHGAWVLNVGAVKKSLDSYDFMTSTLPTELSFQYPNIIFGGGV